MGDGTMIKWFFYLLLLRVLPFTVIGRPMKEGTWEGAINYIAGTATFKPCAPRGETWWLKGKRYSDIEEEIKRRHEAITESPYEKVYARVHGKINKTSGQYGALGTHSRVLYVEEILELRPREESDCS